MNSPGIAAGIAGQNFRFQSNLASPVKIPTSLRPSLRSIHAKQTRHRIFLAQKLPEPFDFQFSIVR